MLIQETRPFLYFHDGVLLIQPRSAEKGDLQSPLAHMHLPFTIVFALFHLGSGDGHTYTILSQYIEG